MQALDFSDPTVLIGVGAITLSAIAIAACCTKKSTPAPKVEETKPDKKTKKGQQKKVEEKVVKKEKVKKSYAVDHPLWIASTPVGGPVNGFAFNVCLPNLILHTQFYQGKDLAVATTSEDTAVRVFDPTANNANARSLVKHKSTPDIVAISDTHFVVYVPYSDNFFIHKLIECEVSHKLLEIISNIVSQTHFRMTGEFVTEFPKNKAEKHKNAITRVELSKNGKYVLTASEGMTYYTIQWLN